MGDSVETYYVSNENSIYLFVGRESAEQIKLKATYTSKSDTNRKLTIHSNPVQPLMGEMQVANDLQHVLMYPIFAIISPIVIQILWVCLAKTVALISQ